MGRGTRADMGHGTWGREARHTGGHGKGPEGTWDTGGTRDTEPGGHGTQGDMGTGGMGHEETQNMGPGGHGTQEDMGTGGIGDMGTGMRGWCDARGATISAVSWGARRSHPCGARSQKLLVRHCLWLLLARHARQDPARPEGCRQTLAPSSHLGCIGTTAGVSLSVTLQSSSYRLCFITVWL